MEESRAAQGAPLHGRERTAVIATAAAFVIAATAFAVFVDGGRELDLGVAVALVGLYAAGGAGLSSTPDRGGRAPSQLVLVPMLFLLPTPLVPLFVALGNLLGRPARPSARQARHRGAHGALRWPILGTSLAPAAVLVALHGADSGDRATGRSTSWRWRRRAESTSSSPRAASGSARPPPPRSSISDCPGSPRRPLLAPVGPANRVRLASMTVSRCCSSLPVRRPAPYLRPGARGAPRTARSHLSTRTAAPRSCWASCSPRTTRVHRRHSQTVVALSLAGRRRNRLRRAELRDLEFGALLHDVGKIAVTNEIINKPGPLTDEEREVMRPTRSG